MVNIKFARKSKFLKKRTKIMLKKRIKNNDKQIKKLGKTIMNTVKTNDRRIKKKIPNFKKLSNKQFKSKLKKVKLKKSTKELKKIDNLFRENITLGRKLDNLKKK